MKIAVVGASGRMGQEILKILTASNSLTPFVGISRSQTSGYVHLAKDFQNPFIKECDVIIDFSVQETFSQTLRECIALKKPLVSGVTGLSMENQQDLVEAGKHIPVLWSSNMSLGVAVLTEALQSFASLKGFDFQIEEFHHSKKRDNPSGTALSLQKKLNEVTQKQNPHPVGIRGGGIFGVHKVWAMSESEVLCFEHQALNRSVFAEGAIQAAHWLVRKPPGLYGMREVILD